MQSKDIQPRPSAFLETRHHLPVVVVVDETRGVVSLALVEWALSFEISCRRAYAS